MTNNIRNKKITVTIGGAVFNLKYDMNAFIEIEEVHGSIKMAFKDLEDGKLKTIRTVLWAGLLHENESLTLKQVGAMIDFKDVANIIEKIQEAMEDSLPDPDSDEKNS